MSVCKYHLPKRRKEGLPPLGVVSSSGNVFLWDWRGGSPERRKTRKDAIFQCYSPPHSRREHRSLWFALCCPLRYSTRIYVEVVDFAFLGQRGSQQGRVAFITLVYLDSDNCSSLMKPFSVRFLFSTMPLQV